MKLYDYPACPFGQKVRIALAEKELEYEMLHVDLLKREQKAAEFLRLNPFGKVPVLVDEDTVVYDSTIILEYLEDEYPHPPLMPDSSSLRARVRTLEDFADIRFILQMGHLMNEVRRPEAERDDERIQRLREDVEAILAHLNAQLGDRPYLVGEFSVADAAFAPRLMVLDAVGVQLRPEWDSVRGWIERIGARPSVQGLAGLEGWR